MKTVFYRVVFASLLTLALLLPSVGMAYTTPGTGVTWSIAEMATDAGDVITWNETSERYVSTEKITISATDSVYIFDDLYIQATSEDEDINIFGVLLVGDPDSTATDSIRIDGEDLSRGDGAGGVTVEEGGRLYMYRVVLTGHGEDGIEDGLYVTDGYAYLKGCRISEWMGYGVRLSGATAVIRNTLFHDNCEYTVNANMGTSMVLRNCQLIRNNQATPGSSKNAISIGIQGSNEAIIDSCYISGTADNLSGGISLWNYTGEYQRAYISNTTIEDCAFGIVVRSDGAYAEVTDCQILNNTAVNDPMNSGSGLSVYYSAELHASHNTITGNFWGITVPLGEGAVVCLGDENATEYYDEGYNIIQDNENNGSTWGFYNNVADDFLAQNNYWGSTDLDEIAGWIYDENDDATKGLVTFAPIWDGQPLEQPPQITSFEPEGETVQVWNDWWVTFSVDVTDPDGDDANLTYQWMIDDQLWGTDTFATANFTGTGRTILAVVTITDEQELTAQKTWSVSLNGPSDVMQFSEMNPDSAAPHIYLDDTINFLITANSPSGEPLQYYYWLDDERVSTANTYNHTFDSEGDYVLYGAAIDTAQNPSPALYTRWDISVTASSVGDPSELPSEFAVRSYPNPFNAEMRVQVSLPHASPLKVALYDILGREVRQQDFGRSQAGQYEVAINGQDLASGLYFLRVSTDDRTVTRKISLIR